MPASPKKMVSLALASRAAAPAVVDRQPTSSRKAFLAIRIAGAAALLVLVFRVLADLETTIDLLKSAASFWLLAGLLIAVTGELVTALKWRFLARHIGSDLPLAQSVRISLVGMFYNNLLPGSVGGDVARLLMAARHLGGRARAAASVFMQRNSGLGGLLIVGNIASWLWHSSLVPPGSPAYRWPAAWFAVITIGYLAVNLVLLSPAAYRRAWRLLTGFAEQRAFIASATSKLRRLHQELLPFRGYWSTPLLLSVISQLIDCTLVYVAARALGLAPPYYLFLVSVPLVTVAALMPVTFNGIGLREIGYILLLSAAGVSEEAAAGIGLLQFGYIAALSAAGGLLVLLRKDHPQPDDSVAPDR